MTNQKKYRDQEWLRERYIEDGLSRRQIAKLCDCSGTTITRWLNKHNINTRCQSEAQNARHDREKPDTSYRNKEWLHEKYWEEELSTAEIAEICECTKETIRRWLDKHELGTRSMSEAGRIRIKKHPHVIKAGAKALSESDFVFWEDGDAEHVKEVMERLKSRNSEDNPNWNGGATTGYGSNWEDKRREAMERDGYECVACGISNEEHKSRHDYGLHVHHIRPIRTYETPEDANDIDNLVTLCHPCHKNWEGIPVRPENSSDTS